MSRNGPCPCGSGLKAKRCCLEILDGHRSPATPEELLRARYVAYGTGAVAFLIGSTDPRGPQWRPDRPAWEAELAAYCRVLGLEGLEVRAGNSSGDRGEVRYVARLRIAGRPHLLAEHARYRRDGGRWLYTDGDRFDPAADSATTR